MSKTVTAPAEKRRCRPSAARVSGAKGGESTPYTPYKAPDTALSVATVKLLYALSEGPIVGPVSGNNSVKLNGTPLLSPDGSENFPGTIWDFRAGTVDQEHIAGFPAIENEASQGLPVELKSDNAWTRAITDQQLSAVRIRLSWPQIWEVRANGDQVGYRIDYAIDLSVNGGSYQTVLSATLNDKGTTEYERSHRIDLPEGFTTALVRVRRLTPNRNDNNFADLVRIKGLTEVIDKKLRYPNLALGGLQFDAKQFQDTPKFSALMRGRIVQVPTNYDPQTRTYTGDWNGIFKLAYTNNPVWIWRDLLLHRRYGLGRRITADMVDHWTLYEIGRYCDVMVPDGKGGLQPRMTTNVYIQDSIEGYALLSDLASVFRGSSCWNGSQVTMVADIPGNEDGYVFTRSNIVGEFEYVAAAFPDRHTRAKVAWDNPENEFKTQPAPVTNEEMIGALGHRMLDISRFGCTVEGEAIRHGIWALKSEQYEEWSVSFTTGMEGRNVEPGQIICVADELFSGRPNGGRISAATKRVITLDIDAEVHQEDRLIINLPSGKSEGRIVKSVSGRLVTVMADYSELPEPECSWSVESADLAVMRFRVQTIEPQGLHQFKIAATQHEPLKYPAIDTGARIDPQPTSIIPPGVMTPPKGITLEARSVVSQGIAVTSMRIAWESVPGAIAYNVEWRKDSGNWVRLPRTGSLGAEVEGIYSGRYVARVSSINAMDVASIWSTSSEVALTGKTGLPPAVSFLSTTSELFGIGIKWGFPAGAEDAQRTEIWYGSANDLTAATKLADLAYPQADYRMQQLLVGANLFFWARLVDRTGNIGPFYPVGNGVMGQSSSDGGPILDQVAGQIGETELGKGLLDRIELIDGPPTLAGSVAQKVASEAAARAAADLVNASAITQEGKDRAAAVLAEAQARVAEDLVNAGKISKEVTDRAAAILAEATARGTAITSEANTRSSADSALSTRLDTVTASTGGNAAAIQTEITARTNADSALGTRIDTVAASTASNLAAIGTEITARTNADSALGTRIDTVVATATTDRTNANAAVTGEATARASADTALGSRVDTVLATLAGKADASAVTALTTRVTAAEGVNTSQGTAITGLTNSLTTTNGNVTTAQNAANAANTLAGGKGKVLVQAAAPAAADQLAQNLWIDITGGANTPKRWTGSAWAAVTDKVAIDAATAAANALSVANTKADASTVSALSNTVTQQGTALTAQGNSITSITASFGSVGGENLMYNPSLDYMGVGASTTVADGYGVSNSSGSSNTPSNVASTLDPKGKAQRIDFTTTASSYVDLTPFVARRPAATPGQSVMLSAYVRGTAGVNVRLYMQPVNAANGVLGTRPGAPVTMTGDWQRITLDYANLPDNTVAVHPIFRVGGAVGGALSGFVEWDRLQLQLGTVVTGWQDNNSALTTDVAANVAATTALTGRVSTVEGVVTSQGDALTTLSNALPGKADASAVNGLSTRVTSAEGTIGSQGSAITGLTNSLTTTNGNVTTAQNAANAANTLAGGKGKVLVQTAAPAAADQLAQNLWIDITGGANTPKRWTGSAWEAVTDKVATDAATAAANALSVANTKADASTVSALSNTVTQQGTALTAQGNSITSITASLGDAGGGNLFYNPSFDYLLPGGSTTIADGFALWVPAGATAVASVVASTLDTKGKAQRLDVTTTATTYVDLTTNGVRRPVAVPGQNVMLSIYVRGTEGMRARLYIQAVNASGATFATRTGASILMTGDWQRLTLDYANLPANTSSLNTIFRAGGVGGDVLSGFVEYDRAQLQFGSVVTGWQDNNSALTTDVAANVAATTALTGRVSTVEGVAMSQGSAITGLTNSLTTTNGNVTTAQNAANAANALAGGKGKVLVQTAAPEAADQLAQNLWIDITGGANTPKRWTGSAWVAVTDKVAIDAATAAANALSVANMKADAAAVNSLTTRVTSAEGKVSSQGDSITSLNNSLTTTNTNVTAAQAAATAANTLAGGKGKVLVQAAAPAAADQLSQNLWIDTTSNANTPKRWSGSAWVAVTDKVATDAAAAAANALSVANTKADAAALNSLTTRVTSAEGNVSSQGDSITSLNNSLTTTNTNVTAAQAAATAANTLAGGKGKVLVQAAAPAASDQLAQNLWIDITGAANTPKRWTGSTWAAVTDKVATDAQAAALAATNAVASKADASAVNALTTRVTTAEGSITSQGNAATALTNRVTTAETNLTAQATSIRDTSTAVTALDGKVVAVTTKVDGIYAQVSPALAGDTAGYAGSSQSLVGVWSEQSARIEDGIATGKQIETVQASVGSTNATVQQTASTLAALDGKVSASYSVKLQVNSNGQYVMAGIGVGIENGPAGLQSQILMSADRFALVNTLAGGAISTPFVSQGGQLFLGPTFIQDGTITNAKIGNFISSTNYIPGQQGWILNKDGTLEINSAIAGGGRLIVTNRSIRVFDESGVKRVQLGDLTE